jgi:chemotaxis protein methyltransferase CheR
VTANDPNSVIAPGDFKYVCTLLKDEAAIVLEEGKEYLVETRLGPLAKNSGFASLADLVAELRFHAPAKLVKKVVDAMTTNETSFYRDAHPFKALQTTIIPELMASRAETRALNIWSAACSTGQEPYSLVMIMKDHFPQLINWHNYILATDLCSEVVEKAKSGLFRQIEVNRGLPAPLLMKYFSKVSGEWFIKEELRKQIDFREMNLATPWPPIPQMDLVLLRNVMIYFNNDTKRSILERVAKLLRPDGYLMLGASETTWGVEDSFERVVVGTTTLFKRKKTA